MKEIKRKRQVGMNCRGGQFEEKTLAVCGMGSYICKEMQTAGSGLVEHVL